MTSKICSNIKTKELSNRQIISFHKNFNIKDKRRCSFISILVLRSKFDLGKKIVAPSCLCDIEN